MKLWDKNLIIVHCPINEEKLFACVFFIILLSIWLKYVFQKQGLPVLHCLFQTFKPLFLPRSKKTWMSLGINFSFLLLIHLLLKMLNTEQKVYLVLLYLNTLFKVEEITIFMKILCILVKTRIGIFRMKVNRILRTISDIGV